MKDIFIRTWVGWQAYIFAKYLCDIYSEYITPWVIMIYAVSDLYGLRLHGYAPYARGLRSGPTEWIIRQIAHKRKLANLLSYSKQWISFSYHLLPIIHAYNVGIPWLLSYAWFRSYAQLQLEDMNARLRSDDMTSVIYPDSDRTSQFWTTSWLWSYLLTSVVHHGSSRWACRMSYHLGYERLHMAWLDDCNILQPGHLVRSR
jgi:hypothetical protein